MSKDYFKIDGVKLLFKDDNGVIGFIKKDNVNHMYMNCGWGCGYVGFPKHHSYYNLNYVFLMDERTSYYKTMELSYSKEEIINGTPYWVIGFDTAHHWNDKDIHDENFVKLETKKLYELLK